MEWISIFAIIASPIIASIVTMRIEQYRQFRREKVELFKTLMSQRGFATNYAWLNAINSISVIFHDDKQVLSALNRFLNAANVSNAGVNELTDLENKRIKLLEVMADSLGYSNIDWEQIRGAYVPQWVAQEIDFNAKMRDAQLAFAQSVLQQVQTMSKTNDGVNCLKDKQAL